MNLMGKPPLGLKPDPPTPAEIRAAKEHMARVKALPCVICGRAGPSDAHHCICGRFGTRRASDWQVIPLCKDCHQDGPEAIHRGKASWVARNGPDHEYLPVVADMLAGQMTP